MRRIDLTVGSKPIGKAKTWAYPNGIKLGVHIVPTYQLQVVGTDDKGGKVTRDFEVLRFGLLCNNAMGAPSVVGLAKLQVHIIKAWLPAYSVHSAVSKENGAWQVYDSFLIHDGPDDPNDEANLYASIGCVEVCGPQQFLAFNDLLIRLSGPKAAKRYEQLAEIGRSKNIHIKYLEATRPKLARGD